MLARRAEETTGLRGRRDPADVQVAIVISIETIHRDDVGSNGHSRGCRRDRRFYVVLCILISEHSPVEASVNAACLFETDRLRTAPRTVFKTDDTCEWK